LSEVGVDAKNIAVTAHLATLNMLLSKKKENIMKTANVLQGNYNVLPESMRTAQAAIQLPSVQEMLRRLSAYNLGIYMPHMHDEVSGEFQLLPETVMQVESGLEVSFQPVEKITEKQDRFIPVAWLWRADAAAASAVCEMVAEEGPDDTSTIKHKMPK